MIVLLASTALSAVEVADTNNFAWNENTGWMNCSPTNLPLTVHYDGADGFVTGYIWSENVGYISLSSSLSGPFVNTTSNDWGVNMNDDWELSGYAWGENIGWINFAPSNQIVQIDPLTGVIDGNVWGENIGWISMGGAPNVQLQVVIDMATNNVPHWWMESFGWTNDFDTVAEGDQDVDGLKTWEEWVTGTSPLDDTSVLAVMQVISTNQTEAVLSWQSVEGRTYYVDSATNLTVGAWELDIYQTSGDGSVKVYNHSLTNDAAEFFRLRCSSP